MDKNIEQRACLKFFIVNGISCSESLKMLQNTYSESTLSTTRAYEWYKPLRSGRDMMKDLPLFGRPSISSTEVNIIEVKDIVTENPHSSLTYIAVEISVRHDSIRTILTNQLGMKHFAGRLVPKAPNAPLRKVIANSLPTTMQVTVKPGNREWRDINGSKDSKKKAHARARFVLMRLLELDGDGILTITEAEPGKNLLLTLQKDRLATDGKRIIGNFLVTLQSIKARGDVAAGERLFDKYSRLDEPWSRWRDIVMLHKQPRNIFVQPNTVVKGDDVELKRYPASAEGMVASWVERFPCNNVDDILDQLATEDAKYFKDLKDIIE